MLEQDPSLTPKYQTRLISLAMDKHYSLLVKRDQSYTVFNITSFIEGIGKLGSAWSVVYVLSVKQYRHRDRSKDIESASMHCQGTTAFTSPFEMGLTSAEGQS